MKVKSVVVVLIAGLLLFPSAVPMQAQKPLDSPISELDTNVTEVSRTSLRPAASLAQELSAAGLHLLIRNKSAQPASNAQVALRRAGTNFDSWIGYTAATGRVDALVEDGAYTVTVSSANEHFVFWRTGITAPSTTTLDVQGTVPVDVTARQRNGQALANHSISFDPSGGMNGVGSTDGSGKLRVDAIPGAYCASVASSTSGTSDKYLLSQSGVNIAAATNLSFDASQMNVGQAIMRLTNLSKVTLIPWAKAGCPGWARWLDMVNNQNLWLSAGSYDFDLRYSLKAADQSNWSYESEINGSPIEIAASRLQAADAGFGLDATTSLWAGGTYSATVIAKQLTYRPGATASIQGKVADGYHNPVSSISKNYQRVPAHLLVRGPGGGVFYEGDCSEWATGCNVALPTDAMTGTYSIEWTIDTGPLQGILRANSQFTIEGTPLNPWARWGEPGCPGILSSEGMTLTVEYGDISTGTPAIVTLSGSATFPCGGQSSYYSTHGDGSFILVIKPAPGAKPGDPYTIDITIGNLHLSCSGRYGLLHLYLPLLLKLHG